MGTLADPLTLLRDFTVEKKSITRDGDHIVFGRTRFLRSAPTAYRQSGGAKDFYTIDSVWSLLEQGTRPARIRQVVR